MIKLPSFLSYCSVFSIFFTNSHQKTIFTSIHLTISTNAFFHLRCHYYHGDWNMNNLDGAAVESL